MASNEVFSLEVLRKEIDLFRQLAEVRSGRNNLHDAKMRAWDQIRPGLKSNKEFEEIWQIEIPASTSEQFRLREREILSRLDKLKVVREHLMFAQLDGAAEFSEIFETIDMPPMKPPSMP